MCECVWCGCATTSYDCEACLLSRSFLTAISTEITKATLPITKALKAIKAIAPKIKGRITAAFSLSKSNSGNKIFFFFLRPVKSKPVNKV